MFHAFSPYLRQEHYVYVIYLYKIFDDGLPERRIKRKNSAVQLYLFDG